MIDGYLTTNQASERSGISQAHLRRLLESATIDGVKTGRDWLVKLEALEYYMANRPKRGGRGKGHGDVQPEG